MANYTKLVDYAAKDALSTGNPSKVVRGTELDTEFEAIETAIATKADTAGATLTGATLTGATLTSPTMTSPSLGAASGTQISLSGAYAIDANNSSTTGGVYGVFRNTNGGNTNASTYIGCESTAGGVFVSGSSSYDSFLTSSVSGRNVWIGVNNVGIAKFSGSGAEITGALSATGNITQNGNQVVAVAPGTAGNLLTSDGSAWVSQAPASSGAPTGSVFDYVGSTAPSGYVLLSGRTIGNASSGGTERANADTSALFELLWNSMTNTEAPVSGGRGASAAADFAANKTITLPDARGRVIAGKDDMGGTTASRLTSGGAGITGTTLGTSGGSQTHTLTEAQLPSHTHSIGTTSGGFIGSSDPGSLVSSGSQTTGTTGSGNAHNNTQPTLVLSKIIKL